MADEYRSTLTADEIESTLVGAVVHNRQMALTKAQQAQARANIGAGTSDSGLTILAYFKTLDELKSSVQSPAPGSAYGVGAAYPYDIYIWDSLHAMWVNNGNIRGADGNDGIDGKDAVITPTQVESGLGYNPGMVNPNLLDNWYFGNPVNQRGQTEYSGIVYTIDRWRLYSSGAVNIESGGIRVSGSATPGFYQKLDSIKGLGGKTLTLSVLITTMTGTGRLVVRFGTGSDDTYLSQKNADLSVGLTKVTFAVPANAETIRVGMNCPADGMEVTATAIKLELGSVQTLAREVNGEWVLNEIPDYGEQLARCQRYCNVFTTNGTILFPLGSGFVSSTGSGRFAYPLPVRMRQRPVLSIEDGITFYVIYGTTTEALKKSAVSIDANDNNLDRLAISLSALQSTERQPASLAAYGQSSSFLKIIASADL